MRPASRPDTCSALVLPDEPGTTPCPLAEIFPNVIRPPLLSPTLEYLVINSLDQKVYVDASRDESSQKR